MPIADCRLPTTELCVWCCTVLTVALPFLYFQQKKMSFFHIRFVFSVISIENLKYDHIPICLILEKKTVRHCTCHSIQMLFFVILFARLGYNVGVDVRNFEKFRYFDLFYFERLKGAQINHFF